MTTDRAITNVCSVEWSTQSNHDCSQHQHEISSVVWNVDMAQEKGVSSWLTMIPMAEYDSALHKVDFRDALCIYYNWTPPRLSSQCACEQGFSVSHAMDCPKGGFPSKRHNLITANLMTEVCDGVAAEPLLQPLSGEQFSYTSAIADDSARSDIWVQGFWGSGSQRAFFDVSICNPTSHARVIVTPPWKQCIDHKNEGSV